MSKPMVQEAAILRDGEVLDVDTDGCLICWNATTKQSYNCGQTVHDYGVHNLTMRECQRLALRRHTKEPKP
jgi:hypothetical protein